MTVHAEPPTTATPRWAPGTYVYDPAAARVGRIADPTAYSPHYIAPAAALIVPLAGNGPAWQAPAERLRPATATEINQAQRGLR
jgi:hypothetical protein